MRRLVTIAISSLVLLAGTVAVASPAGAVKTDTVTIRRGPETAATFGPIPGSFPATTAAVPEPYDCWNPEEEGVLFAFCDTVPLKIEVPDDLGPTDDFLVTVSVTWTPSEDVDGQPLDDIDIYLYDNQQIGKRTNEKSTAWTNLGESATAGYPETVKLFNPTLGDYNLVVVNWAGTNIDYTVTGVMQIESFDLPFEDLGPSFGSRRTSSESTSDFAAPIDLSGDDLPSSGGFSTIGAEDLGGNLTAQDLDEIALMPDADFTDFDDSDFESQLTAPPPPVAPGANARLAAVTREASMPAVAFWLVFLPLLLVAVLVVVLVRRSREAYGVT